MLHLLQLSNISKGQFLRLVDDDVITKLITDSRTVTTGEDGGLFFCMSGANHDGHQYIAQAYGQGIRAFVIEQPIDIAKYPKASFFLADSTLDVLQQVAAYVRASFQYPVIGITGSNGKTIIKEWLGTMLSGPFVVVKSPKSYNSQIGVPLSVWAMQAHHTLAIFEAGISKPDEMSRLEQIINPTIGIFTNLGSAHDEGFVSRQQKAQEKAKLFKNCHTIIYCTDHQEIDQCLREQYPAQVLRGWSLNAKPAKYQVSYKGQLVQINWADGSLAIAVQSIGPAQLENTLHCVITTLELSLPQTYIQEAISKIRPVKMRLEIKEGIHHCYIIDDTYNNDFNGLEVALRFLSQQNQNQKRTVILSDIEQSGLSASELYGKVAKLIASYNISSLVGIGSEIGTQRALFSTPAIFFNDVDEFLHATPDFRYETILIKGARKMHFEKIVSRLQRKTHGTFLEINLEALIHNLNYYRSRLAPSTKIMVMVKALAYGSGSKEVAQLLQHHKVDYLGVAYTDEAVELRENGIQLPILVMNPTPDSYGLLAKYKLEPEVYSVQMLEQLIETFGSNEDVPPVQIKLDTGMRRLGFEEGDLPVLLTILGKTKIRVSAVFTHLAASDASAHDEFSARQIALFDKMYEEIAKTLGYRPIRHVLNSSGISRHASHQYELVRLGIGLYGYDGTPEIQTALRTVGTLKTTISQLKMVLPHESVGYNRAWIAQRNSRIATIAIGYADGFRRAFSNGAGKVSVGGVHVPVVGNVCMDMTMVDVTDVDCAVGDEVVIFGENPSIVQLATWAGTIPYEILTNVSSRVQRVFVSE